MVFSPDAEDNEDSWEYSISLAMLNLDLHCLARMPSNQGEG